MAISQRAVGAWAASNATTQTVTLPTHATGDMLIVRTIRKPFTNPNDTVINTAGWNPVNNGFANGSTANGNGTGSMGFKAFYKIAESASETNPVVTWGTTSAPGAAVAVAYQKGATEAWVTPAGDGGGDATARTSQTSTIQSHVSVVAGDLVDFFRGQCDDSGALTVPTITQTGVTYSTVTEYPATALLDATSNDIAADGGYRTATAGTSSAAAVVTGTSAASEQHGAWMTRLRVVQEYTPALLDQTATTFSPTVVHTQPVSLGLIDRTATLHNPEVEATTVYGADTFGRTIAAGSGLGTADVGGAWSTSSNTGVGVDGDRATWATSGSSTSRVHLVPTLFVSDADVLIEFSTSALPIAGRQLSFQALARAVDHNDFYFAEVGVESDGEATISIARLVSGVKTELDSAALGFSVAANGRYQLRLQVSKALPTELRARAWVATSAEPGTWDVSDVDSTSLLQGPLSVGFAHALFSNPTVTMRTSQFLAKATGNQTVIVLTASASPTVFAPTISQPTSDQDFSPALIDQSAATFSPTITSVADASLGLIDQSAATFAPVVTSLVTISLALADQTATTFTPTVTTGVAALSVGIIDQTAAPFTPTVSTVSAVSVDLVDQTATTSAPTATTTNAISLDLLNQAATTFTPTVGTGGVSATVGIIDQTAATFAPTVTAGAGEVVLDLIDQTATAHTPTITAAAGIELNRINQTAALFNPTTAVVTELNFVLLDQTAEAYAPSITTASFVDIGRIDQTAISFSPAVFAAGTQEIELGLISQPAAAFDPRVQRRGRKLGGMGIVYVKDELEPQEPRPPIRQLVGFATIAVNTQAFAPVVVVSDDEMVLGLSDQDLLVLT